ncbi:MAG TPA: hypothetical protein VG900_10615 [Hyphomicrobiaceae bacterium]|nr:hypothetical protein [Hyphomicrobiaceae bacterium]
MKYVITGRVQPERAEIYFDRIEMGVGQNGRAVASCAASQITVALDVPDLDGWMTAMVRAEDFASLIVGALGFSLGSGYYVELIQVTEEDGTPHVFGVRPYNPEKQGDTLAFDPHVGVFNRALHLAGRDIFFRLAVRDYLQAINDVADCATYCYRAVESIKSSYVLRSGQDRWDEMHAVLGTDRVSITSTIKDYADPVRHGNWTNAKPTDRFIRWRMLALTKDILTRYLDAEQPVI